MRTEIRTMTERDLDAGASLLAARHRADRARTPALSARFDEANAVRPLLSAALAQPLTRGVVAEQGDTLMGFLIGAISLPPPTAWYAAFLPPRAGRIGYDGYAAAGQDGYDLYRRLYAALAPFFLDYGVYAHFIEINAQDEVAEEAWFSLGFGQTMTLAVRDTTPVDADAATTSGLEIHEANTEDIDVVMKLNDDLARHHNASPIFLPYLPETFANAREYQLELLSDPANAHWVAYQDGRPVGMQTFHEQNFEEMAQPERTVYLFQGVTDPEARGSGVGTALLARSMAWARAAGYERCTLHFLSANIAGARFWLNNGFVPLKTGMARWVDERIAWADGRE